MYKAVEFLNSYQREAVINNEKVLLLNSCVGSGKTTVLVHKVLYLYHEKKIPLKDMVVLTFTNKAAQEIKARILESDAVGEIKEEDLLFFGTFHSVARQLLSTCLPVEDLGYTKEFTILDQNDAESLFDRIINKYRLNIKYRKKLEKRMEEYKNGVSLYGVMKYEDEIEKFIECFSEEKKLLNVMDFGDLIKNASILLKNADFKPSWIIIDEFQDTDMDQLEMIDGLMDKNTHVFAVGDPNQVIYTWRGSSQSLFNTFKERYNAKEMTLPINYRSTATILEAARAFINMPHSLEGVRGKGASIIVKRHYNSFNEAMYLVDTIKKLIADGIKYKDIAVFYRMQKQSQVFEDVFKNHGIPYEVSLRKNIKDIPVLNWFIKLLKASVNSRDVDSLYYVLKDEKYGLGLTAKKASALYESIKKEEFNDIPEIVLKIMEFKTWCENNKPETTDLECHLYEYFDIDNYISPTSIYYDEDKILILNFLKELIDVSFHENTTIFERIRKAVDYSSLYGKSIIKESIDKDNDSIKLMTLHASKGLEFKYVFITGANYGIMPLGTRLMDEEEKRLFFVGITRAMDYLEISYHANPEDYRALPIVSPYLKMIPEQLIESQELKGRAHALSGLRKEIKSNMDKNSAEYIKMQKKALHPKYGTGYIISEEGENFVVEFDGYGKKTFSKSFCPLKFLD
ncbi:DNA helicase II [Oxobacter pfennigii]|uniref:DNA 3'-5' helicase n=1 Tax=Oxobacter pfennigii TaxID=36849 RepID=A0A0P9AFU5_9CLOT|nr:ATP-dependent helicase [Oxobacter pfennigii]KPU44238.1 DNA helicase II [Oxobacter pfennigii]